MNEQTKEPSDSCPGPLIVMTITLADAYTSVVRTYDNLDAARQAAWEIIADGFQYTKPNADEMYLPAHAIASVHLHQQPDQDPYPQPPKE
jgi:hypothetical protein